MFGWLKRKEKPQAWAKQYAVTQAKAKEAGSVDGRHYTTHVDEVKELKRKGRLAEAEKLLSKLVDAAERQFKIDGYGLPPWYYGELAIIYRRLGQFDDEVDILERYLKRGGNPSNVEQRLQKARQLARDSR